MSESSTLTLGAVTLVLLVAVILTAPLSFCLLWLYNRAMLSEMRRHGLLDAPAANRTLHDLAGYTSSGALELEIVDAGTQLGASPEALPIYRRAARGAWLTAAVYTVGGVAHALVATAVLFLATELPVYPLGALAIFWAHLWPTVIVVGIVTVADWRSRIRNVLVYVGLGVALAAFARSSWFAIPFFWLLAAGPPTLCLIPFLQPRLRAVGPLVFAFTITGVGGALLAYGVSVSELGRLALDWVAVAVQLPDRTPGAAPMLMSLMLPEVVRARGVSALIDGVALLGFVGFSVLGWQALRWIGWLYESKYISDQSVVVDLVWLIFTLCEAIQRAFDGLAWTGAALGSFVAYKALTVALFAIVARRRGVTRNHRLLLLRVFGFRERSERLIEMVGSRWRYVGSIQLIAATDLASTTVEPHELLDFAHGKLAARYVNSHAALERQLARLDVHPDVDGRFRMNEFFCHDDTWKMTLTRLAEADDLVLMDLRGFSPSNQGCCFELDQFIDRVRLSKVVLVLDRTTDVAFLRAVLDQAWSSITPGSPNVGLRPARVTAIYLTRDDRKGAHALLGGLARALANELGAGTTGPAPRAASA